MAQSKMLVRRPARISSYRDEYLPKRRVARRTAPSSAIASLSVWKAGSCRGAHGLECDDTRRLGRREDLARLTRVGAEGLFDEYVLAAGDAGERLRTVQRIGTTDVDGVDISAAGEFIERGEGSGAVVLGGERGGALGIARERAHKGDALDFRKGIEQAAGDGAGADGCHANHGASFRRWRAVRVRVPLVGFSFDEAGVDKAAGAVGGFGGEFVAALVELRGRRGPSPNGRSRGAVPWPPAGASTGPRS